MVTGRVKQQYAETRNSATLPTTNVATNPNCIEIFSSYCPVNTHCFSYKEQ